MNKETEIAKMIIPGEFREFFEIVEFKEKKNEWNLILKEKDDLVPKELQGKQAVLNGYMNNVEITDFPFRGKLMYISFIRRRWKQKGNNKSYFNNYEFHLPGMKATKEFGSFLKELNRKELAEFFSAFEGIRLISQEDI